MSIEVELARFPVVPMLNDKGIRRALDRQKIILSEEISDDQIQPGSLDARIGQAYVFDEESREAYCRELMNIASLVDMDNYEPSRSHAKYYPDKKGQPIIIPSHAFAEIYIHENPILSLKDFIMTYELRSSRGRLGLMPESIYPKHDSGHYVELINGNHNSIILYGHDKFANLFFNLQRRMHIDKGQPIHNPKIIKKILPEFAEQNLITPEGYVAFQVGKEAKTFKPGMTLDTSKSIDDSFYDTHDLSQGYLLERETPAIVQLTPKVNLPPNIGIMLLHRVPFHTNMQQYGFAVADFNQLNAGWIDQGYNGSVTAHPVYYMMPRMLQENSIFCFGMVYKYTSNSDRAYGDRTLGSHYQNSIGATTSRS